MDDCPILLSYKLSQQTHPQPLPLWRGEEVLTEEGGEGLPTSTSLLPPCRPRSVPHFDDSDEFMQKLTKRLDAVEIVRQYQERTQRRYRVLMAVAFVTGIVSGAVSTWWLLSSPIEVPHVAFQTQTAFLLWLVQNSRLLAAALFPMLMTFAACIITSNVLEIIEMRREMKEEYAQAATFAN